MRSSSALVLRMLHTAWSGWSLKAQLEQGILRSERLHLDFSIEIA